VARASDRRHYIWERIENSDFRAGESNGRYEGAVYWRYEGAVYRLET